MESVIAYIPIDRCLALVQGTELPECTRGTVLFADISGFTLLTEALARLLGPRRGAEELTRQLNLVYDALIAEVHHYGGSVLGFAGDAITCWFDAAGARHSSLAPGRQPSAPALRAAACALALQQVMAHFAAIPLPDGSAAALALKVAVSSGPARRFLVGDPDIQLIDTLAGETLARVAVTEHQTQKGEVVVDAPTAVALGEAAQIIEWRVDHESGEQFALLGGLTAAVEPAPWPRLADDALAAERVRPWLLPLVYERLAVGLGEFLTELRPATALFVRFAGIDYDGDADAGARLDTYIRWVQGILARYTGWLLQLTIGDKGSYFYAAFGAPLAHEDDSHRAVATALELRALAPELDFIRAVQIGVSQGTMRTGAYGGATRRTYGVLGDDVNLAARLMQNAASGQVLVSRAAQQPVADAFIWESLPPLPVKGKSKPITVFRLVAPRERHVARLLEPRYELPMIGRAPELALAEQKLDLTLRGQGQIIAITAEAGMGKSRLVAEIIRLANARQFAGYIGECQSYGMNNSYLVWESILRAFFGIDTVDALDEQIGILEAQLAAIDSALLPRLPLLGVALNLPIPDNELTRSLDAKLRKDSLEALLVDCVRARARTTPLMLVLEDCHWLDPLSQDLIEVIGRAVADLPVLIVVAYRPPELERLQAPRVTQLPNCVVTDLTDFTPEEAKLLIEFKLVQFGGSGEELPATLVEQIMMRAQGNPFYIEELLNYLRDLGLDPQGIQALERLELPSSLHSLILSRIDKLTESQKSTLKVASVIGRLFPAAMLWGAYPQLGEPRHVKADLDALSRLDLTPLDTPEPELVYLFRHVLTQEVAYESLPFATRAVLHDQIGQYIERAYHTNLDQYIDLLAYHYDHSENQAKRREYLRRAGVAAQAAYANDAAIDYYQRLLPLMPEDERVPVMIDLGQVHELVGKWDEASRLYQQALTHAEQAGDRRAQAQCRSALGDLLRKRGDYAEASAWLAEARAGFEGLGDQAGVSRVLEEIGEVYRRKGEYSEARAYYDESLRLAEQIALRQLSIARRAAALKGAGALAIHQGDYATARARYQESLAFFRELGDKPVIASVLSNLGIVARLEGDYAAAMALQEESLAMGRELGDLWGIAASLGNMGMLARSQGDYARAAALYEDCLRLYRQLGEKYFAALTLNNLGDVELERCRYAEARALYREGLAIQRELGDGWAVAYLLEAFGGLAVAQTQPERAIRLAGAAAALRQTIGAPLSSKEQAQLDQMLAPARQALDPTLEAALWVEGRAMTMEQAIIYALAE
jgi:adenylate cyclase